VPKVASYFSQEDLRHRGVHDDAYAQDDADAPAYSRESPDDDGLDVADLLEELREEFAEGQREAASFDFDKVIYESCPTAPPTKQDLRGRKKAGLTSTTIGQLYLRYLLGFTEKQMTAIVRLPKWRGDAGEVMFDPAAMVSYDTLASLIKRLPLHVMPIYLKSVKTKNKGVVSTSLQASHSVPDVVRRLLQQTPLDLMTFAARTGLTTARSGPFHNTKSETPFFVSPISPVI
jgi:hypothetical protein